MPTTPPLCKWPWHICPMPLAKRGGDGTGQFSERAHLPGSSMVSHCRHLSGGRSWQLPRSIELLSCLGATKRSGPTPTALGSRCCAALGLASICRAASWPGRGSSEASRSLAGLFYSTDFFSVSLPQSYPLCSRALVFTAQACALKIAAGERQPLQNACRVANGPTAQSSDRRATCAVL